MYVSSKCKMLQLQSLPKPYLLNFLNSDIYFRNLNVYFKKIPVNGNIAFSAQK